jgi:cation diffusion facilitator family transporter
MGFKWWAYIVSDSVALKTDALESFINIIAVIMAIIAVYHAGRPADHNHPYGHGKIEFFSSAIEGGMLFFGGCYLIYESVQNLILNAQPLELNHALFLSAISGIMNGVLGAWQLRAGKKLQSEAIIADAKHILTDFFTTIGVIFGLFIADKTELYFLDPVCAIIVSLLLLRNAYVIVRRSAMLLSDTEDPELIDSIVDLLNTPLRNKDVIDIHRLRSFRSGNKNYIDLHVVVPEFWNVRHAHDSAEELCSSLQKSLKKITEFHPHVEACMQKYCAQCEVEDCPVRQSPLKDKKKFTALDVIASSDEDE